MNIHSINIKKIITVKLMFFWGFNTYPTSFNEIINHLIIQCYEPKDMVSRNRN